MALNGNELSNRVIDALGVTQEEAKAQLRKLCRALVEYFKTNAEVSIGTIQISVGSVAPGTESRDAAKNGKGRIE